jgi:hypothetical protein
MDEWKDGKMDEWMNGRVRTWSYLNAETSTGDIAS